MVTVHGRTRCQFYGGYANWSAVRAVKESVSIPVIVNGDIHSAVDVRRAVLVSGADGVMIGRGAYGRPWWPGVIARALSPLHGRSEPTLDEECDLVVRQHDEILHHYGYEKGFRIARKHLGWTIDRLVERALVAQEEATHHRRLLMTSTDRNNTIRHMRDVYSVAQYRVALAA
jgi:tRNA-dihydrouridine synthase